MARVKRGVTAHARHKKVLDKAKGSRGRAKNTIRAAIQRVHKDQQYAYRDRKARKRNFRALWIQRINAAAREHGLTYGRFIEGLSRAEVAVDRKVLAELAVNEPAAFAALVESDARVVPKGHPIVAARFPRMRPGQVHRLADPARPCLVRDAGPRGVVVAEPELDGAILEAVGVGHSHRERVVRLKSA